MTAMSAPHTVYSFHCPMMLQNRHLCSSTWRLLQLHSHRSCETDSLWCVFMQAFTSSGTRTSTRPGLPRCPQRCCGCPTPSWSPWCSPASSTGLLAWRLKPAGVHFIISPFQFPKHSLERCVFDLGMSLFASTANDPGDDHAQDSPMPV